jgi:large subunit ribosomal protein L31e
MAGKEVVYTVPLGGAYDHRRTARTVRSMKILKAFLSRHMKVEAGMVRIDAKLNEFVWAHGMKKPPRKVKVKAVKGDDGIVVASLLAAAGKAEAKAPEKAKAEKKPKAKPEAKASAPKNEPAPKKEPEPKQKEVKEARAESKAKAKE